MGADTGGLNGQLISTYGACVGGNQLGSSELLMGLGPPETLQPLPLTCATLQRLSVPTVWSINWGLKKKKGKKGGSVTKPSARMTGLTHTTRNRHDPVSPFKTELVSLGSSSSRLLMHSSRSRIVPTLSRGSKSARRGGLSTRIRPCCA